MGAGDSKPVIWIAGVDQSLTFDLQMFISSGIGSLDVLRRPLGQPSTAMGLIHEEVREWHAKAEDSEAPVTTAFELKQVCGSLQIYPLWSHQLPADGLIYVWSLGAEKSEPCSGNLMTNPLHYLKYLIGETVEEVVTTGTQRNRLVEDIEAPDSASGPRKVNKRMPVLILVQMTVADSDSNSECQNDLSKSHADCLADAQDECRRVNLEILAPLLAPTGRAYRAVPLLLKWDAGSEHEEHVRGTLRDGVDWILKVMATKP